MPGRLSLGHTLVAAALLHAALFVLSGHVHAATRSQAPDEAMTLIAVDVKTEPIAEPSLPQSEHTEPQAVPAPATAPNPPTSPFARRSPTEEVSPASSAMVLPENAPAPAGGWSIRVTNGAGSTGPVPPPLGALGLAGENHFMGRRETEEEAQHAAVAQANRAAGEAMRGALHDHDTELGLGGGGPVITALEASVRDSTAPDESRAVLIAIADETGTVLRVDVESSSDAAAYESVAQDVLKRLQGQKLRVPAGGHGLAMRIDVGSRMANPSGGSVGLDPLKGGAHFDIADLGARARRVIHARVLAEKLL